MRILGKGRPRGSFRGGDAFQCGNGYQFTGIVCTVELGLVWSCLFENIGPRFFDCDRVSNRRSEVSGSVSLYLSTLFFAGLCHVNNNLRPVRLPGRALEQFQG